MAIIQSFYHSIIQSFYHSIILSFNHSIILSFYHSIILSFYHSIILSFNHSSIQSFNHSSIQAFKHSSIQAFKHSSIQAFKQRYHNFYHFYKRSLKNPLFFIIPPFINPFILSLINPCHNIFKPFDSISPIFKPVGLTELNLIQGEDNGKSRSGVKKTPSNFSGC
ncbi:hypothetical protein B0X24_05660 [Helicobacter pylori]|nr:hypothetical protein [Helicobacter pylori]OOP83633.1 hypothetical protein B0X24_05660 [Helicobacter pylori]